jgi:hypothetical protein
MVGLAACSQSGGKGNEGGSGDAGVFDAADVAPPSDAGASDADANDAPAEASGPNPDPGTPAPAPTTVATFTYPASVEKLAVDGTTIYVLSAGAIYSVPKNGGGPTVLAGGDPNPRQYVDMAVAGDWVYFTVAAAVSDSGPPPLGAYVARVPKAGGPVEAFLTNAGSPDALAAGDGYLYVADDGPASAIHAAPVPYSVGSYADPLDARILRVPIDTAVSDAGATLDSGGSDGGAGLDAGPDGGPPIEVLASGAPRPQGMVAGPEDIFFSRISDYYQGHSTGNGSATTYSDNGGIFRVPKSGGAPQQVTSYVGPSVAFTVMGGQVPYVLPLGPITSVTADGATSWMTPPEAFESALVSDGVTLYASSLDGATNTGAILAFDGSGALQKVVARMVLQATPMDERLLVVSTLDADRVYAVYSGGTILSAPR